MHSGLQKISLLFIYVFLAALGLRRGVQAL